MVRDSGVYDTTPPPPRESLPLDSSIRYARKLNLRARAGVVASVAGWVQGLRGQKLFDAAA